MTDPSVALRETLLAAGNAPIVLDLHGNSRSGPELVYDVDRLAGALAEACRPRPRIGLWYRNSISAIEAFLAVEWLGGTRIPVDPGASAVEALGVFDAAGVDVVLTDLEHSDKAGARCLVHDDRRPLAGRPCAVIEEFLAEAAFMVYPRSVTGGRLFGVPMSYRNWHATMHTNVALYRSGRYGRWDERSEVFLTAQQIMHGTGFLGTFPFLAMGLPQVVVDGFEARAAVDAIERHRATATMFVPVMLTSVIEALGQRPDAGRSLRHVLYGGGPVTGAQIQSAVRRVGPVLTQVYGRVEGGWPISILDAADHAAATGARPELAQSCGRPIAEVKVRLRPIPGQAAGVGELLVKCDMTSSDYVDSDGWCSLGDVMRRDQDGYLFYEKRLDRMINTGYHVYPDEIEGAIAQMAGVGRVLVRGEPHPKWGQTVVAYVVALAGTEPAALVDEIRSGLAGRLARYKIPREFRVVKELPPE
jgi:acyl-CoA synthetase (AMP-forming)/AMP-acid ligase II